MRSEATFVVVGFLSFPTLSNHPLSEIAPHDRPRKDFEKHGRPQ